LGSRENGIVGDGPTEFLAGRVIDILRLLVVTVGTPETGVAAGEGARGRLFLFSVYRK
jgi:hypothetical protein